MINKGTVEEKNCPSCTNTQHIKLIAKFEVVEFLLSNTLKEYKEFYDAISNNKEKA